MTCFRHERCRHALLASIAAWPTATHPRYFAVAILGALGLLLCYAYLFVGAPILLWYLATQTGEW